MAPKPNPKQPLVASGAARSDASSGGVAIGVEAQSFPSRNPPDPRKARWITARTALSTLLLPWLVVPVFVLVPLVLLFVLIGGLLPVLYVLILPLAVFWAYVFGWLPWGDLYDRIVFFVIKVKLFAGGARPTPGTHMDVRLMRPKHALKRATIAYALNLSVPDWTEEDFIYSSVRGVGQGSKLAAWLSSQLHRLPEYVPSTRFRPGEDPVKFVMKYLGEIYPRILEEWPDKQSDEALARLCVSGLGAHRLEKEGPLYVVRTNAMAGLPVRPGLGMYGGDCYLDAKFNVVMIKKQGGLHGRLDNKTTVHRPGEPDWPYAKFVFRSSLFSLVTLADHLYGLHMLVANVAVGAVREHLSAPHPLRRFLTPFLFNTVTVNWNAKTNLIQPGTLGPRNFAFDEHATAVVWALAPGLVKLGGLEKDAFEPDFAAYHREHVAKPGLNTPFQKAKLRLWGMFSKFSASYVDAYYPDRAELLRDGELRAFLVELTHGFSTAFNKLDQAWVADLDALTADQAYKLTVSLLARICFEVSVGHEHCGAVGVYAQDVSFCSFRWPEGEMMATKEAALQQARAPAPPPRPPAPPDRRAPPRPAGRCLDARAPCRAPRAAPPAVCAARVQAGLMAATSEPMPMLMKREGYPQDDWSFLFPVRATRPSRTPRASRCAAARRGCARSSRHRARERAHAAVC